MRQAPTIDERRWEDGRSVQRAGRERRGQFGRKFPEATTLATIDSVAERAGENQEIARG